MIYQKQWEFLKRNFENQNLAHAYLFSGQEVESIEGFAKNFVRFVNCQYHILHGREKQSTYATKEACQKCQNCKMIERESFVDLMVVRSEDSKSSINNEKDMMEITIEQIRGAQNFLTLKSYYGKFKSVIIENAERMNSEAQSCLLKTLEEPKGQTMIFLLTSKPDTLLPTITSRCQHVKFFNKNSYEFSEEEKKSIQELKIILKSDLAEKFEYTKKANLDGDRFGKILLVLQKYFRELLIDNIKSGNNQSYLKFRDNLRLIEKLSHQSDTSNINQKLALEVLLLEL